MSDVTGSGTPGRAFFNRLARYSDLAIMPSIGQARTRM